MTEDDLILIDEVFIQKVDDMLDGDTDKVHIKVQVGLILALQTQQAKSTNALVRHAKIQNGRTLKNEIAIADLQKKNIVNWTAAHTKTAITVLIVFILLVDVLVDKFSSIDIILALTLFFRKWLGI